jgi:hypothetical protein
MRRRGLGRGRPSLIGTAARTAVIAGTATAVAGKVSGAQHATAERAAAADQAAAAQQQLAIEAAVARQAAAAAPPPPPPTAAAAGDDPLITQLRALAELRDVGILTEEEFSAKKAQLLGL